VLQYFPDGDDMLVVGANAGLPRNPDWYYNLRAEPNPSVLIEGRSLQVSVHECPAERREAFWSLVLSHAPDYEKYMRRTTRQIPFLRLTPQHLPGEAAEKKVVMSTQTMIEVHLEEFGEHSWVKALVNTLSGSYGSAQYRFVARPSGRDTIRVTTWSPGRRSRS
jgi:deazaflavin-dependent oxidoreductase (nitroreductase family)